MVKNLPATAEDAGGKVLIPRSGRSPAVGNGNPLPYPEQLNMHSDFILVGIR